MLFKPLSYHTGTVMIAGFMIGFTSLIHQIYGIRVLFFFFSESITSVSIGVSAFILGIAIGSAIVSRCQWAQQHASYLTAGLNLLSAIIAVALLNEYMMVHDWAESAGILAWFFPLLFLFIPGFLHGACFPLLLSLNTSNVPPARFSGALYSADTLGAVAGCLLAGLGLIPYYGVHAAILTAAVGNLLTTAIVGGRPALLIVLPLSSYAGILLISEMNAQRFSDAGQTSIFGEVLMQQQTDYGTVRVGKNPRGTAGLGLFIDTRVMCHTANQQVYSAYATQITALLPTNPRVLAIGLGCGFLADALTRSRPDLQLEVMEINPAVMEAANIYFSPSNNQLTKNPRVTITEKDGKEVLKSRATTLYDAIVIDIEEPSAIHSSALYTDHYMKAARRHLKPEGIYSIWAVSLHPDFSSILRNTVKTAFPMVKEATYPPFVALFASTHSKALTAAQPPLDSVSFNPKESRINTLAHNTLEEAYSRNIFERITHEGNEP